MSPSSVTADDVARAATIVPRIAVPTALERSDRLSTSVGAEVFLKREDQQVGRSYKVRGAFHLMSTLTPEELDRGVVCASAGNHAQGLALSCARLEVDGHIFLPATTPGRNATASASSVATGSRSRSSAAPTTTRPPQPSRMPRSTRAPTSTPSTT